MQAWKLKFAAWMRTAEPAANPGVFPLTDAAALAPVLCRLLARRPGHAAILTGDNAAAEDLVGGLRLFLDVAGETRPLFHVPPASLPARQQWIPEHEAARSAALHAAVGDAPAIFVAAAAAALAPTLPPATFAEQTIDLAVGDAAWSPESLAQALTAMDYDNEIEAHVPGEFARRGGIVDLFSPLYENPVRIEFFGNCIESMRFYRADTQRSLLPVERIRVIPRSDSPAAASAAATFVDYVRPDATLILVDPEASAAHLAQFADPTVFERWRRLERADRRRLVVTTHPALATGAPAIIAPSTDVVGLTEELGAHLGHLGAGTEAWGWEQMQTHLQRWHHAGFDQVAFCATAGDAARLQQILAESAATRDLGLDTHVAPLAAGVLFPDAKLVLLSERELFGRHAPPRPLKASPYRIENRLHDGLDLEDGGYGVHAVYGICIYHGIREIETAGRMQEALELEFAESARMYVPLDQIHLVSRYVGATRKLPKLSRVGGAAWKHAREAASQAAQDLASELLRMAAQREAAPGVAFHEDPSWEKLFAASFPYSETEDQTQAIADVLGDMGRPRPMDRLLCGDVGYGKTEVAIRGAFRAVLNGRQVAVLVPTTILAQQHYRTFRERLAEYPVRIDMLSRFRTRGEQNRTLEALAAGRLDIVIGTHRLLQPDVPFANLGLVIVDEEQRFGVEHKERLKHLRAEVDILTMTATPIPRTLYFSLSGIRDLSTIMSPPVDRLPITTVVCQWDPTLIREAIMRELDRKGQVFFLHNRVQTIAQFCSQVKRLVPEARYGIAHGQMHADELEEIMARFVEGEIDVLVCTTIVESGLDIPNANTILIDHAERFGLAELYQLRGRVGRYHHQAYAYFLIPPAAALPTNARLRLAAIRRYTQLGVGFKLALRDLEIRGTGNILGPEQSGHIAAVGFELYCDLLREAVRRLDGRPTARVTDVPVTLDTVCTALHDRLGRLTAAFPPEYIGAEVSRLECYRRLRGSLTVEDLDQFAAELVDRFGPSPDQVQALLELNRIRVLAGKAKILSVRVRDADVLLETEHGLLRGPGGKPWRLQSRLPLAQLAELRDLVARCAAKPRG